MIHRTKRFYSELSRAADGFSVAEMVIIVVIVGLSSAVAVPVVYTNDIKAKITEADVSLTSLRTQLRIYFEKHGEYPLAETPIHVKDAAWRIGALGDLNGRYFRAASFSYQSMNGSEYMLTCDGGDVLSSNRTLNQSGIFGAGI